MEANADCRRFSEEYGQCRSLRLGAREDPPQAIPETVLQCIWYDQLFDETHFATHDGRPLRVLSAGWWNHGEGPDFQGAQIEMGGRLRSGDIEIHFRHDAWGQHGHHIDPRYNNVILIVVTEANPPPAPPLTAEGNPIATASIASCLREDLQTIADRLFVEDYPYRAEGASGHCFTFARQHGPESILKMVNLAGEWRMINKARALRERMDKVGPDQAVYEQFMAACGFSHFKHHFLAVARQFHYDRARQLVRQDPLLLEAAMLQVAGLLPESLPESTTAVPHFARLRALKSDKLTGLRKLPLEWRRVGVRPNNNPERRLAGAARTIARTAQNGLMDTLQDLWAVDVAPVQRRRQFEDLFPNVLGFWATHCTWTGKQMAAPSSLIGEGRIRSIIGNVFVPAALAAARQKRDRILEERVLDFFIALPKEPDNHVVRIMLPRLLGPEGRCPPTFQMQQGLLQVRQDWCEANPSCRNCSMLQYLTAISQ